MPEDNTKDIYDGSVNNMFLSFIGNRLKILIVGGGRAGFIKTSNFIKKGCSVTVVSNEFIDSFDKLKVYGNLILANDSYDRRYIIDKHIVIIATNNRSLNEDIQRDCEELSKIYLRCDDFKKGMAAVPASSSTKETSFALNIKKGSPRTSVYLLDKIEKVLDEYDDYIDYVCFLREKIKGTVNKDEIMEFINSDDFYFFFKKNKHEIVLKTFFKEDFFKK